mmetsp:Transcript_2975/g.6495  ORF Transcript_2975/g.6495 Transcript_2975/m.6495 type:complete len:356 (-) Transcript_2975:1066-2133(-)
MATTVINSLLLAFRCCRLGRRVSKEINRETRRKKKAGAAQTAVVQTALPTVVAAPQPRALQGSADYKKACAVRAYESEHFPSPLLPDPIAKFLADAAELTKLDAVYTAMHKAEGPYACFPTVLRSRIMDDMLLDTLSWLAAGDAQRPLQVVSLHAAGDTRPWRLPGLATVSSHVTWFDVDASEHMTEKNTKLAPQGCQLSSRGAAAIMGQPAIHYDLCCEKRISVSADVSTAAWVPQLQAAGFSPTVPTVWLAESLTVHFTAGAMAVLLADARKVTAGGGAVLMNAAQREGLHAIFQQQQQQPQHRGPCSIQQESRSDAGGAASGSQPNPGAVQPGCTARGCTAFGGAGRPCRTA